MTTLTVIKVERILGSNRKFEKTAGAASRYMATGVTLAPGNLSGHEVCQWRTRGCFGGCVMHFAGQRVMEPARKRAVRLTNWLFNHRESFEEQLRGDIRLHIKRAQKEGKTPTIRLNAASDLDWLHIIREFPQVTFYDYTKSKKRMLAFLAGELPPNYHLTFSASERSTPEQLREILAAGGNVAMVFDVPYWPQTGTYGKLPATKSIDGKRVRVVDGDTHDIRLPSIDGRGVIVGLRLKGTNASKETARTHKFAI